MTYIILAAGKGMRLSPLTLHTPKSMYRLDHCTSVIKRMTHLIREYDSDAEIVIVTGFMKEQIYSDLEDVILVDNPFYDFTNSIASLWFAAEYLDRKNVTIINGDIVIEKKGVKNVICHETDIPKVCIDSSEKTNGDYNVEVKDDQVLVMSKDLNSYYGEYAGITKMDHASAIKLKKMIMNMVDRGEYDQWYENALVQMIFDEDFKLYYEDIKDYRWTEIDTVDDFLLAKQIHSDEE